MKDKKKRNILIQIYNKAYRTRSMSIKWQYIIKPEVYQAVTIQHYHTIQDIVQLVQTK